MPRRPRWVKYRVSPDQASGDGVVEHSLRHRDSSTISIRNRGGVPRRLPGRHHILGLPAFWRSVSQTWPGGHNITSHRTARRDRRQCRKLETSGPRERKRTCGIGHNAVLHRRSGMIAFGGAYVTSSCRAAVSAMVGGGVHITEPEHRSRPW